MHAKEGGLRKPVTSTPVEGGKTTHDTFLSNQRYARQAFRGKISVGGEKHDGSPDPLQFVKKFDPQNTSGATKDSLDIMMKLQKATMSNSLFTSIQQQQNIMGGQLYSSFLKSGSAAGAARKVKESQANTANTVANTVVITPDPDIVAILIATALEKLPAEDSITASDLLDFNEIALIRAAYNNRTIYVSAVEVAAFVVTINELIPIFHTAYDKAK
jgi:hypothetical protein